MGITTMSGAEEFSQQLQEQGQQLTPQQRLTLVACFKATLTLEEASTYSDIRKSYLYKLTSDRVIPHYKPDDKEIFFDRAELDSWLKRNRVKTVQEIEQEATTFEMAKGQKGGAGK